MREAYPLQTIHFDLVAVLVVVLVVVLLVGSPVHQEGSLVVRHLVVVNRHRHRLLVAVLLHLVMVLVALTRLLVKMMVAREADRRLTRP